MGMSRDRASHPRLASGVACSSWPSRVCSHPTSGIWADPKNSSLTPVPPCVRPLGQRPKLLDRLAEALRARHYKTTMIYTHVLNRGPAGVRSPVDGL